MASASITTYTDRSAWRTAAGASSTGNVVDDMNVGTWGAGSPPRGAYTMSGTNGGLAVFPNTNGTNATNGTPYMRCMPEPTTPIASTCTLSFAAATTALVMDINPSSSTVGATIGVQLNSGAGSTSLTLPATDVTATWGLVSTTSFTSVTFSSASGWTPFGIDDLEFPPVAPIVSSISPASGSLSGGTAVTISGYGFNTVGGAPTVSIGGTAATSVTVNDYTSISATTPAGSAGTASVLVTPPGTAGANAANTLFTYLSAALEPEFSTATRTADGYVVQITNYDANWTWAASATAGGTATVSDTGFVTVTGVAANTPSTTTVTTTRSGYADGSATVSATSLGAARTPAFSTPVSTADGYAVQISNYDANWQWSATATAGGSATVSNSGLLSVTGVAPNTSATATVTAARSGYLDGTDTVSASSLPGAARTPAFETPTPTADGYTVQVTNYDANWSWAATAGAGGSATVSNTGLVTVTGLAAGASSTTLVTTTRTGYTGGSATITGSALVPPVASDPGPVSGGVPATQSGSATEGSAGVFDISPQAVYGTLPYRGLGGQGPGGLLIGFRAPHPGTVTVVGTIGAGGASRVMAQPAARIVVCRGSATVPAGNATVPCRLNARGRAARRAGGARVALRLALAGTPQSPTVLVARRVVRLASAPRVPVREVGVTG